MFEVRNTMPDADVNLSRSEERAPIGWGSGAIVYQYPGDGSRWSLVIGVWPSNLQMVACVGFELRGRQSLESAQVEAHTSRAARTRRCSRGNKMLAFRHH